MNELVEWINDLGSQKPVLLLLIHYSQEGLKMSEGVKRISGKFSSWGPLPRCGSERPERREKLQLHFPGHFLAKALAFNEDWNFNLLHQIEHLHHWLMSRLKFNDVTLPEAFLLFESDLGVFIQMQDKEPAQNSGFE